MRDRKHPRHFDEGFKKQIVQLYDSGKSVAKISEEYDLANSTVHNWIKLIHNSGSTKAKDNRTPEQKSYLNWKKKTRSLKWRLIF